MLTPLGQPAGGSFRSIPLSHRLQILQIISIELLVDEMLANRELPDATLPEELVRDKSLQNLYNFLKSETEHHIGLVWQFIHQTYRQNKLLYNPEDTTESKARFSSVLWNAFFSAPNLTSQIYALFVYLELTEDFEQVEELILHTCRVYKYIGGMLPSYVPLCLEILQILGYGGIQNIISQYPDLLAGISGESIMPEKITDTQPVPILTISSDNNTSKPWFTRLLAIPDMDTGVSLILTAMGTNNVKELTRQMTIAITFIDSFASISGPARLPGLMAVVAMFTKWSELEGDYRFTSKFLDFINAIQKHGDILLNFVQDYLIRNNKELESLGRFRTLLSQREAES